MADDLRSRIVEATYGCIATSGVAKTTVEEAARSAGVSRATVYRHFPGGREQLVQAAVVWETDRFVARLVSEVGDSSALPELLERTLMAITRLLAGHEVLQRVLATEPERLLPYLTLETSHVIGMVREFVEPYLLGRPLPPGIDVGEAADYLARVLLSVTLSPGRWDLGDPAEVSELVRVELLGALGTSVDNETDQA